MCAQFGSTFGRFVSGFAFGCQRGVRAVPLNDVFMRGVCAFVRLTCVCGTIACCRPPPFLNVSKTAIRWSVFSPPNYDAFACYQDRSQAPLNSILQTRNGLSNHSTTSLPNMQLTHVVVAAVGLFSSAWASPIQADHQLQARQHSATSATVTNFSVTHNETHVK